MRGGGAVRAHSCGTDRHVQAFSAGLLGSSCRPKPIRTHHAAHLKRASFTVCESHFNKAELKLIRPSESPLGHQALHLSALQALGQVRGRAGAGRLPCTVLRPESRSPVSGGGHQGHQGSNSLQGSCQLPSADLPFGESDAGVFHRTDSAGRLPLNRRGVAVGCCGTRWPQTAQRCGRLIFETSELSLRYGSVFPEEVPLRKSSMPPTLPSAVLLSSPCTAQNKVAAFLTPPRPQPPASRAWGVLLSLLHSPQSPGSPVFSALLRLLFYH